MAPAGGASDRARESGAAHAGESKRGLVQVVCSATASVRALILLSKHSALCALLQVVCSMETLGHELQVRKERRMESK